MSRLTFYFLFCQREYQHTVNVQCTKLSSHPTAPLGWYEKSLIKTPNSYTTSEKEKNINIIKFMIQ